MPSPEVTVLQLELLSYLRCEEYESEQVRVLRTCIREFDPQAALYERWGGPMPREVDDRRDTAQRDRVLLEVRMRNGMLAPLPEVFR